MVVRNDNVWEGIMKDLSPTDLEEGRPQQSALVCINFCLDCLYADRVHTIADTLTERLTYEELIGALLLARDLAEEI